MLLTVNDLKTYFRVGIDQTAKAVNGVSFSLEKGKTHALVGESGCGKTQTAYSIIRLIAENGYHPSGKILFDGVDMSGLNDGEIRSIRGNDISMIFQEPMSSLNPLYRIGNQLAEPLIQHKKIQQGSARARGIELLDKVGIPDPDKRIDCFPHELSGGMKQRVMIAMALACEPKLLIADEPTTALDVTIQAQVLRLMSDLQDETGMSILLITHDMGIVNQMADSIGIMYAGKIVEQGSRKQILEESAHPYTRLLLESIPKTGDAPYYLNTIKGIVPPATEYGAGCLFAERCPHVMDRCHRDEPPDHRLEPQHMVNCHLYSSEGHSTVHIAGEKKLAPKRNIESTPLLTLKSVDTHFPIRKGVFLRTVGHIPAVDNVSLTINKGETLALVGESGCGKTTLGESLLRLNREVKGTILLNGQDIMKLESQDLKKIRRHMQIVFQDPFASLSPRMTIEEIVVEGLQVHFPELSETEKQERVAKTLKEVGLSPTITNRYPHEFSGGQRQRIAVARTLILEPDFIVLDEPTSALDVSVQAQVLNLLRDLQSQRQLTYLFITHNLNVVRYMADKVAIMYLGRIVEYAPVEQLFDKPRHPYTKSLLDAVPQLGAIKAFSPITGDVPSPSNPPPGCRFHPRCNTYLAEESDSPLARRCRSQYPENTGEIENFVACHQPLNP
ncbi:MAG: dipeptide ABC transporter ATP-binding protein [Candidatus Nitrohelix vancouverensis]|uniref:Dipeptide ABC transporter ATP-binding protein n=1 Tax=Candidatus Nitrohelix vancouverensis TaxID=2705534 RepID=A0A7T0G408_9BACT|nr:MAG: dipeptide ABC transporter ATP-binding protein [Candidatus Nitrohelix vancouverensis]